MKTKNRAGKEERGAIIIIVFAVFGILLIMGAYFLNFIITESRLSKSQKVGTQAYYLAEAGVNEIVWKLKHDNDWAQNFIQLPHCENFEREISKEFSGGQYEVSIKNYACGRGEIIAVATLPLGAGKTAQRKIKALVSRAFGSPTEYSSLFTDGPSENMDIYNTKLNVFEGNVYSNNKIDITGSSQVQVDKKVLAIHDLNYQQGRLSSLANCARNKCEPDSGTCQYPLRVQGGTTGCPPDQSTLPAVDFDSDNPNSFKSRAQALQNLNQCNVLCNGNQCGNKCIYSSNEFDNLLWQVGRGGMLTLNSKITYITGPIELRGGRKLIVNGSLVSDGKIGIGISSKWQNHAGANQIKITRPSSDASSGLLSKQKIEIGQYASFPDFSDIEGVIYTNQQIEIKGISASAIDIKGGIIGRKIELYNLFQINILFDNEIILYGLGYVIDGAYIPPEDSPVITIDHWEEQY